MEELFILSEYSASLEPSCTLARATSNGNESHDR